jgi:hypothetical protein
MKQRRLLLTVSSILFIVILAACVPSDSTAITAVPTGAAALTAAKDASVSRGCANAYYPVPSGASWSYASRGSIAGDYSYTRTITAVNDVGFTTSDHFSTGVDRTLKWNCQDGNLTTLDTGSGSSGSVKSTILKMVVVSTDADGYNIPATFEAGKTWSEKIEINGNLENSGTNVGTAQNVAQINCRAGSADTITVPAGTFNTVKATCTSAMIVTTTVKGLTMPPVIDNESTTYWYVKGIGLVKSVGSNPGGNETIVLTQYKI